MGIHEWSTNKRDLHEHPLSRCAQGAGHRAENIKVEEVDLGFDPALAFQGSGSAASTATCRPGSRRASASSATACVDICRWTASPFTADGEERICASAQRPGAQPGADLYVEGGLKTGRIMAKDEDVCLHCGLCAERCPTGRGTCRSSCLTPPRRARAATTRRRAQEGRPGMSMNKISAVNDFVVKFANVNGSGLGSCQRVVRPRHPAHGFR